MRVQAFAAQLAVSRIDGGIVGGFTRAGEVLGHTALVSPEVHVPRDKLSAIVDPDRLGIADLPASLLQGCDQVLTAVAEPRLGHGRYRENVSTTVRMRSVRPVAS